MDLTPSGTKTGKIKVPGGRAVSIATVLAVSFGTLVALGVALVLVIGIGSNRANTLSLLNRQAVQWVDRIDDGLRDHLHPAEEKGRFIALQVSSGFLDLADPVQERAALAAALAGTPQIAAVVHRNEAMHRSVVSAPEGGEATYYELAGQSEEEVQRVWERAREQRDSFWGDLLFDEGLGITFVNLIQPLWNGNEYKGFIGFVVSIPELSEFITEVGEQLNGTGFILHGPDQVLAHPNLISRHPDLSVSEPVVAIDRVGDLVLANLGERDPADGFEPAAESGVAVDTVDLDGETYVVFSRRIGDYGETPWIIGAYVRADQVDGEIERLVYSAIAGLAVLLLSIIAAIVLGRAIAKPIVAMAHEAAQIEALEFASVKPLKPGNIRELRDQALAFNRMLSGLRWFEIYVPRGLVKRLIVRGDEGVLASVEREVTIMFTDIVGFSTLAEDLPASDTADLLNEHFALLAAAVEAEGGTIDKFIGDALMAFWNAPEDQPDHAARACRAAAAAAEAIAEANEDHRRAGVAPVRVRIGLHSGPAVVGNIGAPGRINYTIVGDAVNAAQRLEQLGKDLDEGDDTTVLVSAVTAEEAGDTGLTLEPVGRFELRGRQEPVEVLRLRTADAARPAAEGT